MHSARGMRQARPRLVAADAAGEQWAGEGEGFTEQQQRAVATSDATVLGPPRTPNQLHTPPVHVRTRQHRQQQQQQQQQQHVTPYPDSLHRNVSPQAAAALPALHPFRLHRDTRLSMPFQSDESGSGPDEPDESVLAMARARHGNRMQVLENVTHGDVTMSSEGPYDIEDTSIEEQVENEDDDDAADREEPISLVDPADIGLKEISNLGKFIVSSHKPGNGIDELQSDDLKLFWQSDGPQPHKLTVYFVKRVGIRDIRFYVDYNEDESYTPTKIVFKSGTSENSLIDFATMTMNSPVGWQQVPIAGTGGGPDGNTLVSYVFQMQILENHQNGKDTHLRGIKIYAFDADSARPRPSAADPPITRSASQASARVETLDDIAMTMLSGRQEGGESSIDVPDFMKEPELR